MGESMRAGKPIGIPVPKALACDAQGRNCRFEQLVSGGGGAAPTPRRFKRWIILNSLINLNLANIGLGSISIFCFESSFYLLVL